MTISLALSLTPSLYLCVLLNILSPYTFSGRSLESEIPNVFTSDFRARYDRCSKFIPRSIPRYGYHCVVFSKKILQEIKRVNKTSYDRYSFRLRWNFARVSLLMNYHNYAISNAVFITILFIWPAYLTAVLASFLIRPRRRRRQFSLVVRMLPSREGKAK